MTFWYINKDMIIKSNSSLDNIKDKLKNSQVFDTYKEALAYLISFDNL